MGLVQMLKHEVVNLNFVPERKHWKFVFSY